MVANSIPRVLILHPQVKYVNPTTELWPELFLRTCHVSLFGPGYQTEETLSAGVMRFVETSEQPFDFVVVSEHVSNPAGEGTDSSRARFLSRSYGYSLRTAHQFLAQKREWILDVKRLGIPTIFTFFEFDPYRVKDPWVERVEGASPYILGWGEEFVRPIDALEHLNDEPFAYRASDRWLHLLQRHRSFVISTPAFIDESEVDARRLLQRRQDWSVLGTSYAARREARRVLSESGVSTAGAAHTKMVAAYDRLSRGRIGNAAARAWIQRGFQRALRASKASYTCGSGLEYPVRKFFEIPAAGALLVARPFDALGALGFVDGVNYLAREPNRVLEVSTSHLGRHLDEAQMIADAGRELVSSRHSLHVRAQQLSETLARIATGSFTGSCWRGGQFRLD